jgi:membrane-associated phospholipid phosphatase
MYARPVAPTEPLRRLLTSSQAVYARLSRHPLGRVLVSGAVCSMLAQSYMYLNFHLPPRFDFVTGLDRGIPFVPWSLLVYLSYYPLFLIGAIVVEGAEFTRLLRAVLYANAVAYVGFALLTAHVPRPPMAEVHDAGLLQLYQTFYKMDAPGNSLPSLHVSLSLLVGWRLRRFPGGWLWPLWGVAIAVSTLTTHQHVVADVAAGALLAAWVYSRVYTLPLARGLARSETLVPDVDAAA